MSTTAKAEERIREVSPELLQYMQETYEYKSLSMILTPSHLFEQYFEEYDKMTSKEQRKHKLKFVNRQGVTNNFKLDPTKSFLYRMTKEGELIAVFRLKSLVSERGLDLCTAEGFHTEISYNRTGNHQPRNHPVRIPTAAGEPVRG